MLFRSIQRFGEGTFYVDSVDTDERHFKRDLLRALGRDSEIVSKHDADNLFPIVSAASIIAKVTRDRLMIEYDLDRIDLLHGFGLRSLGVTYSESNALGNGLKEERDGGLTKFGRKAVERMNKVGLLIDCSHCGDRTTLDTIAWSEKPIVLSHIGARALWDSNRLAPDEVLEACAAKGGVIGIECLASREDLRDVLGKLNHEPTTLTTTAERAIAKTLQASCQSPVATLATIKGASTHSRGETFSAQKPLLLDPQRSMRGEKCRA